MQDLNATFVTILSKDGHREVEAVLRSILGSGCAPLLGRRRKGPHRSGIPRYGVAHRALNLRKGIWVLADVYHN